MKLFNTASRTLEIIKPRKGNEISLYSCGPTVYDSLTVGNWTAYIRWDVLVRTLKLAGFKVNWYMNITDVGHLISDGDEGEDKLEKGAKREGITAWEVAEKYTNEFLRGLNDLHICVPVGHLVKATDHIPDQIDLIKQLEKKGLTYVINDGVYYDSTKFKDYGQMAHLDIKGLQSGARVATGDKKHSTDFALWKFSPKGQKRDMEWQSPWGVGFPGWHIECSAMAMKYLGDSLDIHTGGIDHIPVHHTNEIAQSEGATGKKFVKYWIHSNFMQVDGKKISKSLNNGFTLDDLKDRGYEVMAFKLFALQSNYQTESNFTFDGLDAAVARLRDFRSLSALRYQKLETSPLFNFKNATQEITQALFDNLNIPKVLSVLSNVCNELIAPCDASEVERLREFIDFIDSSLGLNIGELSDIDNSQKALIGKRAEAKEHKNWQEADRLRDELSQQGIGLNDTPHGTTWHYL